MFSKERGHGVHPKRTPDQVLGQVIVHDYITVTVVCTISCFMSAKFKLPDDN